MTALVGLGTATASAVPAGHNAILPPQDVAVVTVSPGAGGPTIAPGFLGLSLENTAVIPYAGSDPKRVDPVFLQLVRNLTPDQSPVLRIGGDSTDWAWYPVPGLAKPGGVRVTLTRRWLAVMHAVASDLNARLIMGIDLEADSRAAADGEASAFERWIGRRWIEALEIGNEPELYGTFTWYVAARRRSRDGASAQLRLRVLPRRLLLVRGRAAGAAGRSRRWIDLVDGGHG